MVETKLFCDTDVSSEGETKKLRLALLLGTFSFG